MDENQLKEFNALLEKMIKLQTNRENFYFDNLEFFVKLSLIFRDKFKDFQYNKAYTYVPKVNNNLIVDLLLSLPPRFYAEYSKLLYEKKLLITEDKIDRVGTHSRDCTKVSFNHNYDYLIILAHEIAHATNLKDENNTTATILSEFISIYYENLAKDRLVKKFNVNSDEIDYLQRISVQNTDLYERIIALSPLIIMRKYGEITEENIQQFQIENNIDNVKGLCEAIYTSLVQDKLMFGKHEENFDNKLKVWIDYMYGMIKYLFATCLAFYARENLTENDVNEINNEIILNSNTDVYELLNKYNIKLDDEFINKALDAVQKYIDEHNNAYEQKK